MIPIKVNADYEAVLFYNKAAPPGINHALEFLAFYLEDAPVCTTREYPEAYLDHVEALTGRRPKLITNPLRFENWWGKLEDIPLERELNSKAFVTELSPESQLVYELSQLSLGLGKYLAKDPYGMSGQGIVCFDSGDVTKLVGPLKKSGKLLIEPFHDRVFDFSHYVLSDGTVIAYENLVDNFFQYKGTLFSDIHHPDVSSLSFYDLVSPDEWGRFQLQLEKVIERVQSLGVRGGYSIDSYVYRDQDRLRIRAVCEINYRKTMGLLAWLFSKKFGARWNMLLLGKPLKRENAFSFIQEKVLSVEGCLYLSPGDTRFEVFFLSADSEEDGAELKELIRRSLPDCQFPIEIKYNSPGFFGRGPV